MQSRSRRFFWCFVLILILGSAGTAFAKGRREDPLLEARALIEENRYTSAMLLISRVILEDPERLDDAEVLMKAIREAKDRISEKYGEVIDLIVGNATEEEIYAEIQTLKDLDKEPDVETKRAIDEAEFLVGIVVQRNLMNAYMDEALALLRRELYWEAIGVYLEGIDQEFGRAIITTGRITLNDFEEQSILATRSYLDTLIGDLIEERESVDSSYGILMTSIEDGTISGVDRSIAEFGDRYGDVSRVLSSVDETISTLTNQIETIERRQERETIFFYLRYMRNFLEGRRVQGAENVPEGISFAIGTLWRTRLEEVSTAVSQAHSALYRTADTTYDRDGGEAALPGFRDAADWAEAVLSVARLWEERDGIEAVTIPGEQPVILPAVLAPQIVFGDLSVDVVPAYESLVSESAILEELRADASAVEDEGEFVSIENRLRSSYGDLEIYVEEWAERRGDLERIASSGLGIGDAVTAAANLNRRLTDLMAKIGEIGLDVARRKAELKLEPILSVLEAQAGLIAQGRELLSGEDVPGQEELDPEERDKRKYPSLALTRFVEARENLAEITADVSAILDDLRSGDTFDPDSAVIREMIDRGMALSSRIDGALTDIAGDGDSPGLEPETRRLIDTAQRLRREGDNFIIVTRSALGNGEFDNAENALTAASDRFRSSLDIDYDDDLAATLEAEIPRLRDEIVAERRRVIEREVTALIDSGKVLFRNRQYEGAQNDLSRAKSLWDAAFNDQNPVIEYWYRLAISALSVEQGRVLKDTDPLYPEMRSLLNFARESYLKGKAFLEMRPPDRVSALRVFGDATETINRVLDNLSENSEALVLNLMILSLSDPDELNREYRRLADKAAQLVADSPAEAYNLYVSLREIRPSDTTVQRAVTSLEFTLGLREPVIPDTSRSESNTLTAQAKRIVDARQFARYSEAKELLDNALTLWPENDTAQDLYYLVLMNSGDAPTRTLSPADTQLFGRLRAAFEDRDYVTAWFFMDKLWERTENRLYVPLIDLRTRLQEISPR